MSPTGRTLTVPGFFAADGNAAQTSARAGNVWRVHLTPWETGRWSWHASFRTGKGVAVDLSAGEPLCFDGARGTFSVAETDKSGRDFRSKGSLMHAGERYLRFSGTGERFLKGGANSPENLLAYEEFDGTTGTHRYRPHQQDWKRGDPQWKGSKGRGIIGAVNYLASKGVNSQYFLTMNVGGDGDDVWPWTGRTKFTRFDVSKLGQWEILFSHMTARGIQPHVVLQEFENVHLLDGGDTGVHRKLYLRELVARFAHHPVLQWNIGEENNELSDAQRMAMADYLRAIDPYDHPQVVHTLPHPQAQGIVYRPLLGHPAFDGVSIQARDWAGDDPHVATVRWIEASARARRPWAVSVDECCYGAHGALPDDIDPTGHHLPRSRTLWGNLMAGGAGAEHYFPGSMPQGDLSLENFRTRDRLWDQTRYALHFFRRHLPYWAMTHADDLAVGGREAWVLAAPGEIYAVYLPEGGTTALDMEHVPPDRFNVLWYDPRNGGRLRPGSVAPVAIGNRLLLGSPPEVTHRDWVALVQVSGRQGGSSATRQTARRSQSVKRSVVAFRGRSSGCAGTEVMPVVNESNPITPAEVTPHGCQPRPPVVPTGAATSRHRWSRDGTVAVDVAADHGSQVAAEIANATAVVFARIDIPVSSVRIEIRAPYRVIGFSRTPSAVARRVPFPASLFVHLEGDEASAYGGIRAAGPKCADGSSVASSNSLFFNDLTTPTRGEFRTQLYCASGAEMTRGRAWVQLYVHASAQSTNGAAQQARASAQLVRVTFRTLGLRNAP